MKNYLVGDTLKATWVDSGVTPTAISHALYDGAETLVNSVSMTNSGNGHYYALFTLPDTPGFYVSESVATISGYPFKRRIKLRAVKDEVD